MLIPFLGYSTVLCRMQRTGTVCTKQVHGIRDCAAPTGCDGSESPSRKVQRRGSNIPQFEIDPKSHMMLSATNTQGTSKISTKYEANSKQLDKSENNQAGSVASSPCNRSLLLNSLSKVIEISYMLRDGVIMEVFE